MDTWYLGTVGFAYKAWQGVFYPPWLDAQSYLATYSQCFNALEMDSTFYAVPRLALIERWVRQLTPGFQVCPKTPKAITHQFQLPLAQKAMQDFLTVMREFGEHLGPVLLQFPPTFTASDAQALDTFLSDLPGDIRFAIEFRHLSWWGYQETIPLLQKHRAAWVAVDYAHSPRQITPTTDFLYIRWLGEHGRFQRGSGERTEVQTDLLWWQQAIQTHSQSINATYGFFNDDYAGHAPESCNQFKQLLGLPTQYPQFPKQGTLF